MIGLPEWVWPFLSIQGNGWETAPDLIASKPQAHATHTQTPTTMSGEKGETWDMQRSSKHRVLHYLVTPLIALHAIVTHESSTLLSMFALWTNVTSQCRLWLVERKPSLRSDSMTAETFQVLRMQQPEVTLLPTRYRNTVVAPPRDFLLVHGPSKILLVKSLVELSSDWPREQPDGGFPNLVRHALDVVQPVHSQQNLTSSECLTQLRYRGKQQAFHSWRPRFFSIQHHSENWFIYISTANTIILTIPELASATAAVAGKWGRTKKM